MCILIGGDICPMGRIQDAFIKGDASEIFHDLLQEISDADISIANLECPLVTKETPIVKAGPVLGSSVDCVKGFLAASWNVLNLANNHSYDHDASGLRETLDAIKSAGLSTVGAGMNIYEAQTPVIRQVNGKRIAIFAMAEGEFSVADHNTPGANPLDLINFISAVRRHKQQGIFIVLIHGGMEYYPYPSPEMIRRCRFMVEMGADAVICCHAHCPQPWEIYDGRPIIYGLGNLVFETPEKMPDAWYEGYLAKLTIEGDGLRFEPIPYVQSKKQPGVFRMNDPARRRFLDEMQAKSIRIQDRAFVELQWGQYCSDQKIPYLTALFGYNRIMRKLRKSFFRLLHSKKDILRALHLVRCETHQEVLNEIFNQEKRS